METKYIAFDDGITVVVFPSWLNHTDVARVGGVFAIRPISAGFVQKNDDGTFTAYGESITLNLKSDPKLDSKLLNKLLQQ